MKYPPVFYWVVILTGCAASSRMTAAPIAMAAPVTKAAPVPTLDLYNWPSTDPRVSAASFKEGVTTIDKVEAVTVRLVIWWEVWNTWARVGKSDCKA